MVLKEKNERKGWKNERNKYKKTKRNNNTCTHNYNYNKPNPKNKSMNRNIDSKKLTQKMKNFSIMVDRPSKP